MNKPLPKDHPEFLDPLGLLESGLELASLAELAKRTGLGCMRLSPVVFGLPHVRRWPSSATQYVADEALAAIEAARPRLEREAAERQARAEAQVQAAAEVRARREAERAAASAKPKAHAVPAKPPAPPPKPTRREPEVVVVARRVPR